MKIQLRSRSCGQSERMRQFLEENPEAIVVEASNQAAPASNILRATDQFWIKVFSDCEHWKAVFVPWRQYDAQQ